METEQMNQIRRLMRRLDREMEKACRGMIGTMQNWQAISRTKYQRRMEYNMTHKKRRRRRKQ